MLDDRTRNRLNNMLVSYAQEDRPGEALAALAILRLADNPNMAEIHRLIEYTRGKASDAPDWVDMYGFLLNLAQGSNDQ